MKSDSGKSVSPWMKGITFPQPKEIDRNIHIGVGVIGAGIAGVTCAYLLTLEGKSVTLFDDGPIAGGETSRTTAHLSNVMDEGFCNLEKLHGAEGARLALESHAQAISRIESIIAIEKIDCDFKRVDGYLFLDPSEKPEFLDKEKETAIRLGMKGVSKVSHAPLDFDTGPCLKFTHQAQFDPLKYLNGLMKAFLKNGGKVMKAHVEKVEGGAPAYIHTSDGFTVSAESIVVATNTPFNDWVVMHTKQAAYRTYAIGALVPKDSVTAALYWDTANPYHYIRVQEYSPTHDLLIVGGEDHKTGQPIEGKDPYLALEEWARVRFPLMQKVEFNWSGQVMETIDGLAYIGRNPLDQSNVYIATGDCGQGMTHGTIAGMLITDLIWGRENEWEKLYNPSRKTLAAAWTFAQENTNVIAQYADWFLKKHTMDSADDIPAESGAIIQNGFSKTAVYREKNGDLTYLSPICPHLGGIVTWNEGEKTWDCPCHGSRFDCHGKVVNGPAVSDLCAVKEMCKMKTG